MKFKNVIITSTIAKKTITDFCKDKSIKNFIKAYYKFYKISTILVHIGLSRTPGPWLEALYPVELRHDKINSIKIIEHNLI